MSKPPLNPPLRTRLLLLTITLLVPAGLLAGWLVIESHRNQRTAVKQQLSETARSLSLVVDRQLSLAEAQLRALATSPVLDKPDLASFSKQARETVIEHDRWIRLQAADGQHVMNTRVPDGQPLPQTMPPLDYAPSLAQGRTFFSNLITGAVQPSPVLAVTVPILRNDTFVYALSLVIQPRAFNDLLSEQRLTEQWVASIIDRDGIIVARTRNPEKFVGKKATREVLHALSVRDRDVIDSLSLDGDRMIAAFERSPKSGWTVAVGAPQSVLYDPALRLASQAAAGAFLLVGIGLAMSYIVARPIVRSIEKLVSSAHALGSGALPRDRSTGIRETDQVIEALGDAATRLAARERDLQRLNETLEARVQARTAELGDANRALSIRNRELQDFAHVASHDLQEPLRGIASFAELLVKECGQQIDDSGKFYLSRIQASTERMRQLVRDILAFSSISTEPPRDVKTDLDEVVANVTADLAIRLGATGGSIVCDKLGFVRADPAQMHQLLLNLVNNALKFHRKDVPPVVEVSLRRDDTSVKLLIQDNGIGFDPIFAEKIFTPFERLHGRSAYEGTGIGLAIVRRIVERHGGEIRATGRPGAGSRFEVTLPA